MARKPLILKEGDACARGGVLAGQKTNNRIVCKNPGVYIVGHDGKKTSSKRLSRLTDAERHKRFVEIAREVDASEKT
jgi:hypothetical protein